MLSISYSEQRERKAAKNKRWKPSSDNFTFHKIWKCLQRGYTLLEREDVTECNFFRRKKIEQLHTITKFYSWRKV